MQDLKLLNLGDLLDILVDQTAYHTQLIATGKDSEQLRLSAGFLEQIQEEIILRKNRLPSESAATQTPSNDGIGIAV